MRRYTLPNRTSPGSAVQTRIQTVSFASISRKAVISAKLHRMNSMLLSARSTLAPENASAGEPHWKFFPLPVLHLIDFLPFTQCGICVLMKKLGLYDLTPALCHLDYTMSEAGGVTDFVRQYTLASGGPYCDCGYKRKRT